MTLSEEEEGKGKKGQEWEKLIKEKNSIVSSSKQKLQLQQKKEKQSRLYSRRGHFNLTGRQLVAAVVIPTLVLQNQELKSGQNIANAAEDPELTEEFLALDKKKREFRAKQLEIRKDWDEEMAVFMTLRDEKTIIKKMEKLINIIRVAEGLPLGVTKKDMVTKMRSVKKVGKQDGFWTTDVEKAYQSYIRAVDYMQSPNTDRQI